MKLFPSKYQPNHGFALIATILLMVLLAIITIGTLSLSVVTLRTGNQDSAQARARANARMALMIAIGELQKQMGPDQRISAKGDILDPEPSQIINRHWTGAWDSWKAGDSESSQHSTIQGVADEMAPSYLPNRNDHFRKWLVSLTDAEASSIATPRELSLEASNLPSNADDAIFLVAEGSLGDDSGSSDDFVAARLLDIKDMNTSQITGRYGWWVGDESQKARIMEDSYAAEEEDLTSVDKIFRNQAPASMGNKTVRGLENIQDEADFGKVASLATLDLVEGVVDRPAQKNFHDITPFSFSVLSDVREGGLKRDLSTLLERPVDPNERSDEFMLYKFNVKDAWANDAVQYPTLPNAPQECVPIQDLAAFYQLYDQSRKAGIKYTSSPLPNSIQATTPNFGTYADFATTYQREYTTLYRNPVPIKVQFAITLQAVPITPADRTAVRGVVVVNQHIPPTDTHKLRFAVIPAITLWNPFNVPIVMEGGQTLAQQIVVKPPPIAVVIRKKRSDGSVFQTSRVLSLSRMVTGLDGERRADLMRINFARNAPVVFQPGEVRVFSASVSGDYFISLTTGQYHSPQNLNSQKNLVDAKAGWDSTSILPLRNSAYGGYGPNPRVPLNDETTNVLMELGGNNAGYLDRLSHTMNANSDEFEFTIYTETPLNTANLTRVESRGTSPVGSAFSFYLNQRLFSSGGGQGGHGYLNLRNMGLTSRYGLSQRPIAFNGELLKQGAATIQLETAMEPIPASVIAGATAAGESVPFIQFGIMTGCETSEAANGGLFSGRKFPSRPFLHSSALQASFIDQTDPTAPYNHGWNWWIDEMNSILETMVQQSQSGNGFHGGGYTAESGTTHVIQQEIPVTPPISIAALSHARIGGFTLANEAPAGHGFTGMPAQQMESSGGVMGHTDDAKTTLGFQRVTATGQAGLFPHVLQAIGNSYANPNITAGVAYDLAWKRFYSQEDGERDVVFADHSYLANKALWDDYFFSSITPQSSTIEIFGTTSRDAKQVASEFFFGAKPLPNRRIIPYQNNIDEQELDALFATKDTYTDGLADKIAGHLMVKGPFNVNSTSVEAWKVLFSSLKSKPIAYLDGGKAPKEAATGSMAPIGMGSLPTGLPAVTADTEDARDPAQWKGLRVITEAEIDALSQAMVREVKKRGPFLSLSEFVNRRLDPNNADDMALKGALQAALDYDGADSKGPEVTINKNFRSPARTLDSEVDGLGFAFEDAAKGPAAYGSSAYVDQADVLRQFAEQLTPRGDTFVIRTYGDALDKNGKVIARAWCEAIVQRSPDYVDKEDENHLPFSELQSESNKRFGRSFQIYSFRWLNSSEI